MSGIGAYIRASVGGCNGTYGTWAFIIKAPSSFTNLHAIGELCNAAFNATYYGFVLSTTAKLALRNSVGITAAATTALSANGHYIVAVTKASGTVAPRFHWLRLDDAAPSWTHENSVTSIANGIAGAAIQFFRQASTSTSTTTLQTHLGAYWKDTVLTDDQIETLWGPLSFWFALAPTALWTFDVTGGQIVDRTGGGANYSGVVGSVNTVQAMPPMWKYTAQSLLTRLGNLTTGSALVKIATEVIEISQTALKPLGLTRQKADTVEVGETKLNPRGLFRLKTDTVQVGEVARRLLGLVKVKTESVEIGETALRILGIVRQQADSVEVDDNQLKVAGITRTNTDTVEIGEATNYLRARLKVQSDTVEVGESTPRLKAITRVLSEGINIGEATNYLRARLRIQSDGVNIGSTEGRIAGLTRTQTDEVEIGESTNYLKGMVKIKDDIIEIGESAVGTTYDIFANLLHIAYQYFYTLPELLRPKRRRPIDNDDDPANDADP